LAIHSLARLNQLVADALMVACPIAITVILKWSVFVAAEELVAHGQIRVQDRTKLRRARGVE